MCYSSDYYSTICKVRSSCVTVAHVICITNRGAAENTGSDSTQRAVRAGHRVSRQTEWERTPPCVVWNQKEGSKEREKQRDTLQKWQFDTMTYPVDVPENKSLYWSGRKGHLADGWLRSGTGERPREVYSTQTSHQKRIPVPQSGQCSRCSSWPFSDLITFRRVHMQCTHQSLWYLQWYGGSWAQTDQVSYSQGSKFSWKH